MFLQYLKEINYLISSVEKKICIQKVTGDIFF